MKLNWKTSLFMITIISAVFVLPVLAATKDPWGPQWYTPYDGNAEANKGYVTVTSLKWSQASISEYDWKDSWEWETRPNNVSTWTIWGAKQSFLTNLPNGYYEHAVNDTDDVTIGANSIQNANTTTSYYGYLAMEPKYPATYPTFTFESEYGYDFGVIYNMTQDSVPVRYEELRTNGVINTDYYW